MMEMAVGPGGTAPRAAVPGYRVAGKTGTAHKPEAGGYAEHKYVSSFVGFGPVSDPRFIVAVMLDEPAGAKYYGGDVSAPVFSSVMGAALRMLSVPPDAPQTLNVQAPARPGRTEARAAGRGRRGMIAVAAACARAASALADRLAQLGVPLADLTTDSRAVKHRLGVRRLSRAACSTAAPTSPRRSRAARRRCSGSAQASRGTRAGTCPTSRVEDLRARASEIAGLVYGDPSAKLWMVGVTGTNGKTSVAQWIAQAFDGLGRRAAVLGTLGNGLVGERAEAKQHHAGPDRAAARARRLPAPRREGRGDGGLEPRPRPGARGRHQVRRRGVHEPHARPPRLPRHDGGLRRGQVPVVQRARGRPRRDQRRRRLGTAIRGPAPRIACRRDRLRARRAGACARAPSPSRRRGCASASRATGARARWRCRCSAPSTSPTCSR